MKPFIYALVDPIDVGHVRYVGMAFLHKHRPYQHAKDARRGSTKNVHLMNWIRKIQSEGREPAALILEEMSDSTSREFLGFVESCYIKSLREVGYNLTNVSSGGDGGSNGPHPPEIRAKISAATKAGQTPEARAKMSAAKKAYFQDPENRKKRSEQAKAASTAEVRAKIGAAGLGRRHSDETKARMSAAHIGLVRSEEHCANLSAAQTPESRAKASAWHKKRFEDPALKEKHSAALKQRWQDPEYREKVIASRVGLKRSEETKQRMREAWVVRRAKLAEQTDAR